MEPALALIEISSIARAAVVLDALTKQAPVRLLRSEAVSPGKFLILFAGGEGEVEEAFQKGCAIAGKTLLDSLFLPDAEARVAPAIGGREVEAVADGALFIGEFTTVAAALLALDRALKSADVDCLKLRLAKGIGGKAYFILAGELSAVQAAQAAATSAVRPELWAAGEIVARLSAEVRLEHL